MGRLIVCIVRDHESFPTQFRKIYLTLLKKVVLNVSHLFDPWDESSTTYYTNVKTFNLVHSSLTFLSLFWTRLFTRRCPRDVKIFICWRIIQVLPIYHKLNTRRFGVTLLLTAITTNRVNFPRDKSILLILYLNYVVNEKFGEVGRWFWADVTDW